MHPKFSGTLPPMSGPSDDDLPDTLRKKLAKAAAVFERAKDAYAHAEALPCASTPDPADVAHWPEAMRSSVKVQPSRQKIIDRAREYDSRLADAVEVEIEARRLLVPLWEEAFRLLSQQSTDADDAERAAVHAGYVAAGYGDAKTIPVAVRTSVRWLTTVKAARERNAAAGPRVRSTAEAMRANDAAVEWLRQKHEELRNRLKRKDHGII